MLSPSSLFPNMLLAYPESSGWIGAACESLDVKAAEVQQGEVELVVQLPAKIRLQCDLLLTLLVVPVIASSAW